MFESLTQHVSGSPWTYVFLFVVAALDVLFPFVPSETSVILAGVLAATGDLMLVLVIASAAAGAILGDNSAYVVGRTVGERLVKRFFKGERRKRMTGPSESSRNAAATSSSSAASSPAAELRSRSPAGCWRCAGTGSSASTSWPAFWASYAALLGYFGGRTFEKNPLYGFLVAFAVALAITGAVELYRRLNRVAKTHDSTRRRADRRIGNRGGWRRARRSVSGSRRRDRLREQGRVADQRAQRAGLDRAGDPLCTADELLRGHASEPAELPRARLGLDARHHERLHGRAASPANRSATSSRVQAGAGRHMRRAFRPAPRFAKKHVPFLYFASGASHVRSLSRFDPQRLPDFAFVVPNLCHDMHDCTVATGDAWLKRFVSRCSPCRTRSSSSCSTRDRAAITLLHSRSGRRFVRTPSSRAASTTTACWRTIEDMSGCRGSAPREPRARSPASGGRTASARDMSGSDPDMSVGTLGGCRVSSFALGGRSRESGAVRPVRTCQGSDPCHVPSGHLER